MRPGDFLQIPDSDAYRLPLHVSWAQLAAALQNMGLCYPGTTYQGTAGRLLAFVAINFDPPDTCTITKET